ncbi:hypothetical protein [Thalassospira lucentensis]|uniref:hypothetical protein n=1 Tax=Thalassospira lucentensis TaxID=168935 RepID=UPI00399D7365
MFNKKTLFVVGAGASFEFGLPLGDKLKDIISQRLRSGGHTLWGETVSDSQITRQLRTLETVEDGGRGRYFAAANEISRGLPLAISIDNFIDAHRGNVDVERCGKIAIFHSILQAERESKLFFEDVFDVRNIDVSPLKNSWIVSLFRMATEGVAREELKKSFENLSFISFNYDRCIAHFFETALRIYYGLEREEAAEIVGGIPILHPYGSLGPLVNDSGEKLEFGADIERTETHRLYQRIRTFTEQITSEETLQISNQLSVTEQLIFVGFGYHRQNLKLLEFGPIGHRMKVLGTAYMVSEPNTKVITNEIKGLLRKAQMPHTSQDPIIRNDMDCSQLLQSYQRMLTS